MAMAHRILILGGGTGGTLVANRLLRLYGEAASITVIDRDDAHVYQPGLLFVPFGLAEPSEIVRPRHAQFRHGIDFRLAEVESVDIAENTVHLLDAPGIEYDVLVIATGASLQPQETEGLAGPQWGRSIHTFYSLEGASALRRALDEFDGGRLVINVIDMPIKCPVAPLEFCFLADWQLRERGLRDRVELAFVTPLDGAFTKPVASAHLDALLMEKGIRVESEFATGRVDASARRLHSWDEREVPYDLLVTIPVHGGPEYIGRSPGLGDPLGFVATDRHTLQSKAAPNVFAIGDAADVPTSKAGSVTHFEGEIVVENIRRFLEGDELSGFYDGHANCFVETGFHRALLIDFDYETEPLPGRFHLRHGPQCTDPEVHNDNRYARRLHRRGRLRGLPRGRAAVERADGAGDRRRQRDRAAHRPPLAGHQLHAQDLPGDRFGSLHPQPRKDLRSPDQGALRAVPQRPRKARREDRRHSQAPRLHLDTLEIEAHMSDTIEKVSIIISKGSLEGIYPGLIMANGARMEGIGANVFFTFFGLDAINRAKHEHVKVATVGNPGLHLATWAGGVPGISSLVTHQLAREMEKLDIPPIPEFVEMIADSGAGLYACKASVDLFKLSSDDFIPQVKEIITVGEFYGLAGGGQIIFT